ncbi:XAP5, circadian clock regulator domain-containing protein [Hirsutella rhossiliensis]|uniref:XAP5, circadian clock regulator domain-containing protein n=1 Tax=Hirsutella rhossiliensis TaxID=111463 RepID=A0A9P8MRD9_9HYPO|nr:XAP5, circadian clock regulator domain-containing protein [Hirsutella rhossiliensis]KAH0959890.1 XAP5, circadian clock regulator domain-containing protein [Hirsutella rhossiliensis]
MSDQVASRFTPQNKTTHERLSTTTVGLVALSDFRKRRAEVLEQQEREAREAAFAGPSAPDRSQTNTPDHPGSDSAGASSGGPAKRKKQKKKQQHLGKKLLSFGDDDDEVDEEQTAGYEANNKNANGPLKPRESTQDDATPAHGDGDGKPGRFRANAAVGVVPRPLTKAALRKEADEREALRRDYLALQEAIKATEIAIPFVFYDGAHIPGGTVRLKKGDFVWVFLDRCRKVGVGRKNGEQGHPRRGWARAGVDDLMLVRDTVIIPHHYDFYYFVMNKNVGPAGRPLFDFSTQAAAASSMPDINTLEGAADDPKVTKVVDRRWYARNKHIYPASTWQEFDPERDFANEIRKDTGGNTFFFSK